MRVRGALVRAATAVAALLASGVNADPPPTFTLGGARVFNSSGADLAGVWTSPSLLNNAGSAVASVNWLRLRLFSGGGSLRGCTVAASGIAFVGTGGATVETALVVDHTSGVVGAGYIDFAVVVGGPATVAAPGGSDITVAAGTLTCGDSNATNVAVAGNQAAGSPFAGVLKLGMPLSATLSWGSTIVSGALGFDGAFVDAVSARAFNGRAAPGTAITLTLADLALSPSMQTSWSTTDIAAYVDLPPAFAAAGITWTLDSAATYAANSNLIAWTASVDGWASLAHGVYDVVARPGAVGTVTSVRYAGARLRIVYGTAAQVANAGAAWAPATQRVALTASNTTARTFVTNATQLGVAQMYGAGGATPFTGLTSLASLYSAVYALADGAYGTDISLAVRGFDKVWDVAVNPVAATASDNFTVHAMLGEGTYVLKRASTAAFAAITDAQGVSDPYNADVVVIIDRTPPVAANVSYPPTGAPQAVGGVGNFLIPAGICTDAVSTQSAQIAVTKVAFVGGDGQGYSCATPAPLSAAYCQAPAVRGPPQELLLAVTCADEAGNTAVGYATVPIVTEVAPTLLIADVRGVQFSSATPAQVLKTGGAASLTAAAMVLTVQLMFPEAAFGVSPGAAPVLTFSRQGTGTYVAGGLSTPAASANRRVYTYSVTVAGTLVQDDVLTVTLAPGAGARAGDGVANLAAVAVSAAVDVTAPTLVPSSLLSVGAFQAAQGFPYFAYLSSAFASDTGAAVFSAWSALTVVTAPTADVVGLTLAPGVLGRAAVSGTAMSVPTARADTDCAASGTGRWVKFTVTVSDEAGNSNTAPFCVAVTTLATSASLGFARNLLSYATGGAAAALDPYATFSYGAAAGGASAPVFKLYAVLETPDTDQLSSLVGTLPEALAFTAPGGATVGAFAVGAAAGNVVEAGLSGLLYATLTSLGGSADALTPAVVAAALRGLTYADTMTTARRGARTARLVVTVYGGSAAIETVVATAAKAITTAHVNAAPQVAVVGTVLAPTWAESDALAANGSSLFTAGSALVLTDVDDASLTTPAFGAGLASVTLALAGAASSTYGACDPARDALYLPTGYALAPAVYGVWAATPCTLTLRPLAASGRAPAAAFAAAVQAVQYINGDRWDPTNGDFDTAGPAFSALRWLSITAIDGAASGQAAAPSASSPLTAVITPTLVDDPPLVIYEALYGPGGAGYSTNFSAAVKADYRPSYNTRLAGAPGEIAVHKYVLDYEPSGAGPYAVTIPIDLSALAPRVYAGGALLDPDTPVFPAALTAADITVAFVAADGVTPASPTGLAANGVGAASLPTDFTSRYNSATRVASLVVSVPAPVSSSPTAGEVAVAVTLNGRSGGFSPPGTHATLVLFVDVRARVCRDDAAFDAADWTAAGATLVADPNFLGCAASPTFAQAVVPALTPAVEAAITAAGGSALGQVVALPSAAVASGSSHQVVGALAFPNWNFVARNASAAAVRAALLRARVPGAEAAGYLAYLRASLRGLASFYFEKHSFATPSGSLAFTFAPVGAAAAAALPPLAAGEVLDAQLLVELGPACATFVAPVTYCQFVGETPAGYTRTLRVAHRRACADATRGWAPWVPAAAVAYDALTGLLCGNVSAFSVAGSVLVPTPASPTEPRPAGMGAACPNGCSGAGYCRTTGVCACWPGYAAVDCSRRACPAAEAWDAAGGVAHGMVACAGRGACDGNGTCTCAPGFEGAACQRAACPAGCSGRGRCVPLALLPAVRAAGGADAWEASRLQTCVCDAGFTGASCAQRTCPYGDDPETPAPAAGGGAQVQQVLLAFPGGLPTDVGNPSLFGLDATDELALVFTTAAGQELTTARVADVFDAGGAGATNLARALRALPGFAISDVVVTAAVAANRATAEYRVTFAGASLSVDLAAGGSARLTSAANSVAGNQALLACMVSSAGALGCQAPGCAPTYRQARLLDQPAAGVTTTATAILAQPPPPSSAAAVGAWGVVVAVAIATRAETGAQTYAVNSTLWGAAAGDALPESPLPPAGTRLRNAVPLVYGLEVNFDAGTLDDGVYTFRWKTPTCAVAQLQAADADLESIECSRRGTCNRKTGECTCFKGYNGADCGLLSVVI